MKYLTILLLTISSLFGPLAFAQEIKGGCTSIEVKSYPAYNQSLYNVQPQTKDCAIIINGHPAKVRYFLEKRNDNTGIFESVGGLQYGFYQYSNSFNNLPKGTYRVIFSVPIIRDNFTCPKGVLPVYNSLGQHMGHLGTFVGSPLVTSNIAIVGNTTSQDIAYTFVDPGETGSAFAFDSDEDVLVDFSASRNYDYWTLAIFESGPTHNRFRSTGGWREGQVGAFNLSTELWPQSWGFLPFHSYTVQFAIDNEQCKNFGGWTNLNQTFFVCPPGSGCRFGTNNQTLTQEIKLGPNPASNFINVDGLDIDPMSEYQIRITDLAGKMVRNMPLKSTRVDISDVSNGIYLVNITKGNQAILNKKLMIQK